MLISMEKPPLLELVVEVQFASEENGNIILGHLEKYLDGKNFSLKQELQRTEDEKLPRYKFKSSTDATLSCFVSQHSLTISWSKNIQDKNTKYPGWSSTLAKIYEDLLVGFYNLADFKKNIKVLRYRTIDTFETVAIMKHTNLQFSLGETDLRDMERDSAVIFSLMSENGLKSTISMANAAEFSQTDDEDFSAVQSIIDITTDYGTASSISSADALMQAVQVCHEENKNTFEKIIKKEYAINELGAEYDA